MYRCESCDRWFCEKHLKPRLFHIMGLDGVPPESKLEFYKEWDRRNSHPDFQYSRKRLEELHLEEKLRFELIDKALNGENFSRCPKCGTWYNLYEEIVYCPKCRYQLAKISQAKAIPKSWMEEPPWRVRDHFEKRKVRGTHNSRRRVNMKPWYWFLLLLSIACVLLFLISQYYIYVLKQKGFGFELSIYSAIILGILMAIGLFYLERWWRKHMRRFWNG